MTVEYSPATGERYDSRFVCQWHIYRNADGTPTHMGWCGLDCPAQRELVGMAFMEEKRYRPHPQWDAMAGGAA